jgi:hypothetical protein
MRFLAGLALSACLVLSGCGGGGSDDGQEIVANPNPTNSQTPTVTDDTSSSESTPPPTSDAPPSMPKLGDTVQVDAKKESYKVSALDMSDVKSGNPYEKPRKGNQHYGLLAQWCLDRNDGKGDLTISSYPWSLRFPDGTISESTYLSEASVTPDYPDGQVIPVGTCGKGWIYFEGPSKQRPNMVVYAPTGTKAITFEL